MYKIYTAIGCGMPFRVKPKLWRLMKLSFFICLIGCLQVSASSLAQKISLTKSNASLWETVNEIRKQSGYSILCDPEILSEAKQVNVNVKDVSLEEALKQCFVNQPFIYTIKQKTILITRAADKNSEQVDPVVITGKVIDNKNLPIPGVTVKIKNTQVGVITNNAGIYKISVSDENAVLVFSFVGYTTQEIPIQKKNNIDVVLQEESSKLNEVVVVGYGTQKRADLTGAISSVDVKTLDGTPLRSVDQALQGRTSGVQFTQNSGMPGSGSAMRIRGGNSVYGSNEPLYVIDGIPVFADQGDNGASGLNPLNSINPADIASIDVLKDASATAIYGSRGGNGVVLITTKRGKKGAGKVNFDSFYGIQSILKKYSLLNAAEFEAFANEATVNEGGLPVYDLTHVPSTTDWQSLIFRKAPIQNHQISISGGEDKTRFFLSANYFGQDGIAKSSDFRRYSLRANLDRDLGDKFKIGNSLTISNVRTNQVSAGSLFTMATLQPDLPVYQPDGSYTSSNKQGTNFDNPIALLNEYQNYTNIYRTLGNVYASAEIIKGLTLKMLWGVDAIFNRNDVYLPQSVYSGSQVGGQASISSNQTFTWLNENTVNYKLKIKQHSFDLLGGFTQQNSAFQSVDAGAQSFLNDNLGTNALNTGALVTAPASSKTQWSLLSFLGRINYSFKGKYLVTFTSRSDGSSRFGKNNRYGFFPSAALAWRMEDESFIKNLNLFSTLKLRVSHGITGNQDGIGNFPGLDLLGTANYTIGGVKVIGLTPSQVGNPDLKWESTAQTDGGLELGFLNNRLLINIDAYYKKTSDLLLYVKIPVTSGFGNALQNRGQTENKGLEFTVTAIPANNKLKWETSLNISFNRNKVLDLAGVSRLFTGTTDNAILEVGRPLGLYFGYKTNGIFQNAAEVAASATPTAKPGDIRYIDNNNDGKINDDDRVVLGSAQPRFFGGFTNTLSYKNIGLLVFLQGSYGNQLYNSNKITLENLYGLQNQTRNVLNRWTPTNTNTDIPRASSIKPNNRSLDRYVEDGSYLRVKNVQISYNLPGKLLDHISKGMSAKLYINAQNLLTITNYSGLDPEVSRYGSSNIAPGFDSGPYPNSRTYTFGFNVGF
jgi:TonB-linked SusC/RagA family outer membrane protein